MTRALTYVLAALVAGCATTGGPDSQKVGDAIRAGTGASPRPVGADAPPLPAGVSLEDGVTQEEAVAIALWNNPDFQVAVADLGFARADLVEAGLLTNPVLSLLFPVGPKQLESTLKFPIEVLWERPRRLAAARIAGDAAAARLVQSGLDVAASAKIAHAEVVLAQERQMLAGNAATLTRRISDLTQTRLAAGDIGELEARASRVDAARATLEAMRSGHDVAIAIERLRAQLGLAPEAPPIAVRVGEVDVPFCVGADALLPAALAARPEIRAAELDMEAAGARLGWERSRVLALTALVDANGEGEEGFEIGPGIEMGIPLFNQNQAGKARAAAELQHATASYAAARQRVALDVREASVRVEQARESQAAWRLDVVEPLEANVAAAERSFTNGETSFLFVLESSRQLVDARLREQEIEADLHRATARLERAVGRNCGTK